MKTLTRSYLAQKLNCDPRLITEKLKEIGIGHSKKLFPLELELLRQKIGDWN